LDYSNYVKHELLSLVPVLIISGRFLKKSTLPNNLIPITLGITGIVLSGTWVLATSPLHSFQDVMLAIFTSIVQGILCAGAAVYGHQLVKQVGGGVKIERVK
jgi:hypothetical protein